MLFAEGAGQAVAKLCGHNFRGFEAPRAFTLSKASDGEHESLLFLKLFEACRV
jgi:hypothetical protein